MSANTVENDDALVGASKSSSFRACQICRQRKVKCVAMPGNETTCEYCYGHGLQCQAVRPAMKRKRVGTASELRARVEQLEARLSSTLREPPARAEWQEPSPESSRTRGQQSSAFPYQSPDYYNSSELGTSNLTTPDARYQSQPRIPGKWYDEVPRGDVFSPLPHSSLEMTDCFLSSRQYDDNRAKDSSNQTLAQMLPLPLPSLSTRMDSPTTSFNTSGSRSHFSAIPEPYHRQQDANESRLSGMQSTSLSAGQMRTLSSVPIPYQESPEGARHADLMADDGSNDPDFTSSVYHHTRIIGPIAPFDADFYELCIAKGLATMDDRDCAANDKLWARFYRLSSDPTLPLYKFHFINGVTSADFKSNVPPEAIAQLEFWTDNYGDVLLQNFIAKISPRLRLWSMAEIRATTKDSLLRRSTSQTCAIYAMAATCVDSWSIKKRAYLALSFHRCAMTYLQRALNPPSLDAIRTLVLLAAFPLQSDSSLLNSWALALAFEMKLNIDPEHWQIPEEEKTLRRRLFWLIIVSHRWSASKHLYPNVSNDCYDTLVPTTEETSDQTFSIEVQVSDIVASITQSFYSVRGAKMVHHNHEASMVVAKHLESQVIEVQNTLRHASSSSDMFASFSLTMLHLNLGFATLMIHRPFLDSKSLGVMDALEYHQKAAQAALGCISTLQRMPDAYFTEAWPTHSIVMLATITFTLLRESILSKDDNLRIQCREGLMNFMAVTYHQASRWSLSRFGSLFISVANALSGEEYGDWTTTPGPVAHEYEISPLMRNSENAPTDNIDFATFEWEHFGQLLGLDSSSLIGDWMQA